MSFNASHSWPSALYISRHAESVGNIARAEALLEGADVIDVDERDSEVPLSECGQMQAAALGRWLAATVDPVDVVLSSPYERARQTSALALEASGWRDVPIVLDERLREKELGMLNRLTRAGIEHRYPEESARRSALGKFYYRAPGGESWADVILRVRSAMERLRTSYAGKRVVVVAHQVVVLSIRYILEEMNEAQLLAVDRQGEVGNCSVTTYETPAGFGQPLLREYNLSVCFA